MSNLIKKKIQDFNLKANFTFANVAGWVEKESEEFNKVISWLHEKNQDIKLSMENELKKSGILLEFMSKHNIITTAGMNVLARLLAGDNTYSGEINYGAVGVGASPIPALGSTQLVDEQKRNIQSSQSASGSVAYIDFVFSATDFDTTVIGDITEFGNFIDGTASADSGQMFSYIATGGWTKNATTSLFISCEYTLANA